MLLGIDVSEFKGTLDWKAVKASGVHFTIIRAGYGENTVDTQFYANMKGAAAVGLPVGVYWFSYALTAGEAKAEAEMCTSLLKNYDVTLPVFYDFEYDTVRYAKTQGVTLGRSQFNSFSAAFCQEVERQGYKAGVYYNLDYYKSMVDLSVLGGYVQWYAQYAASASITDYAIWQYSSSGSLSGVSGEFDMDYLKDLSLLSDSPASVKAGWQKTDKGWRYALADGTFLTSKWEKLGGDWYYFDAEGYCMANGWMEKDGYWYYFSTSGKMIASQMVALDENGRLMPLDTGIPVTYETLGDVTNETYRQTLEKLISKGYLKGLSGSGDKAVLALGEDAVRVLVVLDRAGAFGS